VGEERGDSPPRSPAPQPPPSWAPEPTGRLRQLEATLRALREAAALRVTAAAAAAAPGPPPPRRHRLQGAGGSP